MTNSPTVKIIHGYLNAHEATGLAIIIDVYRAFTTACYLIEKKPEKFLVTADIDYALSLKNTLNHPILIGERKSIKIDGFDFTNSPSAIMNASLEAKNIIFNTTAGTQGVIRAINASEIITGSFVNTRAIELYIQEIKPHEISLVCTNTDLEENEDIFYAEYLSKKIKGEDVNLDDVLSELRNHYCSSWFFDPTKTSHPIEDIAMCLDANKFDFVLKAEKINEKLCELKVI